MRPSSASGHSPHALEEQLDAADSLLSKAEHRAANLLHFGAADSVALYSAAASELLQALATECALRNGAEARIAHLEQEAGYAELLAADASSGRSAGSSDNLGSPSKVSSPLLAPHRSWGRIDSGSSLGVFSHSSPLPKSPASARKATNLTRLGTGGRLLQQHSFSPPSRLERQLSAELDVQNAPGERASLDPEVEAARRSVMEYVTPRSAASRDHFASPSQSPGGHSPLRRVKAFASTGSLHYTPAWLSQQDIPAGRHQLLRTHTTSSSASHPSLRPQRTRDLFNGFDRSQDSRPQVSHDGQSEVKAEALAMRLEREQDEVWERYRLLAESSEKVDARLKLAEKDRDALRDQLAE